VVVIFFTTSLEAQVVYKNNKELLKEFPCYSYILTRENNNSKIFVSKEAKGLWEINSPTKLTEGMIGDKEIIMYQRAGEQLYNNEEAYCGQKLVYNSGRYSYYLFIPKLGKKTLSFKVVILIFI